MTGSARFSCRGWLSCTVEVQGVRTQEQLGAGDLMRPWDDDNATGSIPAVTSWKVLAGLDGPCGSGG